MNIELNKSSQSPKNQAASVDGLLDIEEAIKEANMMEAVLQRSGIERKPTAKEYQQAFQIVDRIKREAAAETDEERFRYKVGRILNRAAFTALMPVMIFDTVMSNGARTLFITGDKTTVLGPITDPITDWYSNRKSALEDAALKLSRLERATRSIERGHAAAIGEGLA